MVAINTHFSAVISVTEAELLDSLPDAPAQRQLTDREWSLAERLKRLDLIAVDRRAGAGCMGFVAYAGATPLGRESAVTGLVRLS